MPLWFFVILVAGLLGCGRIGYESQPYDGAVLDSETRDRDADVPAARDGSSDGAVDGGSNSGFDASLDAGPDAGLNGGLDAGADAGLSGGLDAGPDSGSMMMCTPTAETCNGLDDNCDGTADEAFACVLGSVQSCTTGCGTTGSQTCDSTCAWNACTPPAEICNGTDDDCDGVCDNGSTCCAGTTGSCITTCGSSGTRTCNSSCGWGTCLAPAEICNGVDDDCDGIADEDCGGIVARVGTFTKDTTGVPTLQTVTHGLGVVPSALLIWSTGSTSATGFTSSAFVAFGMTDSARSSRSVAMGSIDGASPPRTARRIADSAITFVQPQMTTPTALADAVVSSWDATTFTLDWLLNGGAGFRIHYLAIGGSGISSRVMRWQMPGAPATVSITGSGFQPATVLHAHAGHGFTTPPPGQEIEGAIGIGAMDSAGRQWANAATSIHGGIRTDTQRGQRSNAAVYAFDSWLNDTKHGSFVSMDPDGFTLSFGVANSFSPYVGSLALAGVRAYTDCVPKSTTTGAQPVAGLGFTPVAVLISSVHSTTSGTATHARWGAGASDGTRHTAGSFTDASGERAASVYAISDAAAAYLKVDNATPAVTAEASVASLDSDGFTLSWATNDAESTLICYWALGAP